MMVKLVVFDLGGVVATNPFFAIQKYAWEKGIPSDFLQKAFAAESDNPFHKLEVGELSLSQFKPVMNEFCMKLAKAEGVELREDFNAEELVREISKSIRVIPEILNASAVLRKNGIKTCILTNDWTDDSAHQKPVSFLPVLHYFDKVFQSSKLGLRKPNPEVYKLVCSKMGFEPSQVVYLDDLGNNLKPAKEMGMVTILVQDPISALKTLKDVTGVNVFQQVPVPPCTPQSVPHCFAELQTGVKMHYVEMGQGPVVILVHGFPEMWYNWKYQIPALALAGYRVIVPDLRGMGQTNGPQEVDAYSHEKICSDIIALMDFLYIPQATLIGHDWGGAYTWDCCLHYPERVKAVISMTPLFPAHPKFNMIQAIQAKPGTTQYMLYFQKKGPPEKEFEQDVERTFKLFLRGGCSEMYFNHSDALEKGGIFVGAPSKVERCPMVLTDEDLKYFADVYGKCGFGNALNVYRNAENNRKWNIKLLGRKVQQPSLIITTGKDPIIKPENFAHMDNLVCNLSKAHIKDAGHWAPLECPLELNRILINWLKTQQKGAEGSKL